MYKWLLQPVSCLVRFSDFSDLLIVILTVEIIFPSVNYHHFYCYYYEFVVYNK